MPSRNQDREDTPHRRHGGLRGRLWLASLGGALVAAIATGSVVAAVLMAGDAFDPTMLGIALAAAGGLGLGVALLCGAWLVRGVAERLRRIEAGIASGHLMDSGRREWGEIAGVADGVRDLLDTQRELGRSHAELESLRESILRAREAVERWTVTERWEPLLPGAGGLAALAESLDRGFAREMEVLDQNLEAARLARAELVRLVEDARASAETAEHGYVEATALVTTVREIGRVAAEIQQAGSQVGAEGAEPSRQLAAWREEAARALEELVQVSGESVELLGAGLLKVHEIAGQVQLVSNRATLIALNAVVSTGRPEAAPLRGESATVEMKQLAREVRAVTERVTALSDEVGAAVQAANDRMRTVREHMLSRLEALPAPPASPAGPVPVIHGFERLREMVQDAARKGERLSESQERVSSDVQRLTHRLEEEARDLEGLLVRLTPLGDAAGRAPADTRGGEAGRGLRVVDASQRPETPGDTSQGEEVKP